MDFTFSPPHAALQFAWLGSQLVNGAGQCPGITLAKHFVNPSENMALTDPVTAQNTEKTHTSGQVTIFLEHFNVDNFK